MQRGSVRRDNQARESAREGGNNRWDCELTCVCVAVCFAVVCPAAGKVFIHGINMLPFTPFSEQYLTADWVKEEYPVVYASITPLITDEWKGFLWGDHAVIDSTQAWEQIRNLNTFDGGNTRSNLMYFAATRPTQIDEDEQQVENEWQDGARIGLDDEEVNSNDSRVALE